MNVSVIIPTYKRTELMLKRAIKSVCKQAYKNYEIIIVDDNDKDNKFYNETLKCESNLKKENNIKFIYHNKNKGANAARNTGIKNSKYDVIAFLDSDDEWQENYLEMMISKLEDETVGLCYSGYYIINPNSIEEHNCDGIEGNIFYEEIISDRISPTSCVIVKKNYIKQAGLFDEKLPARQDFDMWLRLTKICSVSTVKKPLVKIYRNGHESISSNLQKRVDGTNMVYDKILKSLSVEEKKKYGKKINYGKYNFLSDIYIQCKEYDNAIFCIQQMLKNGMNFKYFIKMILLKLGIYEKYLKIRGIKND